MLLKSANFDNFLIRYIGQVNTIDNKIIKNIKINEAPKICVSP